MKIISIILLSFAICSSSFSSINHIRAPRAAFITQPLVPAFTDIEKESSEFTIGLSETTDDIFDDGMPKYLPTICRLSAKSSFPDTTISAGYRKSPSGPDFIMEKKLYDNSEISMQNLVSEVLIEFVGFQTDQSEFKKTPHLKDRIIFKKQFQIQPFSKRIPNYPDKSTDHSGVFLTKSDAYPLGGLYYQGINLSDIQPQLFYLGTNSQSETYIKSISAKEALQSDRIKISKEVPLDNLSSLEDDIYSGKVKIHLDDDVEYSSITSKKDTLTSDIFTILFEKSGN